MPGSPSMPTKSTLLPRLKTRLVPSANRLELPAAWHTFQGVARAKRCELQLQPSCRKALLMAACKQNADASQLLLCADAFAVQASAKHSKSRAAHLEGSWAAV